jgi:hypothetical protein
MTIDFIYTWTVLPRAHLQRVTYDRESLNTCLLFFTTFQNNSCFHVNIDLLKLLIIKCNEKNAIEKGHENKH